MATINGTGKWVTKRVHKMTWANLANSDVGSSLVAPNLSDKSIQVLGTFGVGGTLVIEGSNDGGTTWHTLNDSKGEGNDLSFTVADIRTILENPERIRPKVTTGDGTTSLTCIVVSKSTA